MIAKCVLLVSFLNIATANLSSATIGDLFRAALAARDSALNTITSQEKADDSADNIDCAKLIDESFEYLPPWDLKHGTENATLTSQRLLFALLNITNTVSENVFNSQWLAEKGINNTEKAVRSTARCLSKKFEFLDDETSDTISFFRMISHRCSPDSELSKVWMQLQDLIINILGRFLRLLDDVEALRSKKAEDISTQMEEIHKSVIGNCTISEEMLHPEKAQGNHSTSPLVVPQSLTNSSESQKDPHKQGMPQASNNETTRSHCQESLFTTLTKFMQQEEKIRECYHYINKPLQQTVLHLYNLLAYTDAIGYFTTQASRIIQRESNVNFISEFKQEQQKFVEQITEKAEAAYHAAKQLPNNLYGQVPVPDGFEGDSFIQFTEVLQGYVANEVNLNSERTCSKTCEDFKVASEESCHKGTFCNQRHRCDKGNLYDCKYFGFTERKVCESDKRGRRYDWIEYKKHTADKHCRKNLQESAKGWRSGFYRCDNCVCLCDQPGPRSDRYISLKESVSNISAGRIVTGVKFYKKGRVVHIQIQEGLSLPRGGVNYTTTEWLSVETIVPDDSPSALTNSSKDYATLSYNQRALNLDHLVAPEGHVVTGLRFRLQDGHLSLEMQVTPIDFRTGSIDPTGTKWVSSNSTSASGNERKEVDLSDADTPMKSPGEPYTESGNNHFVKFQATSIEKDGGQTTIPFLDSQKVALRPSTWLTGVALVHKGNPGYGGFVSFKVAAYDFLPHMLHPASQDTEERNEPHSDLLKINE